MVYLNNKRKTEKGITRHMCHVPFDPGWNPQCRAVAHPCSDFGISTKDYTVLMVAFTCIQLHLQISLGSQRKISTIWSISCTSYDLKDHDGGLNQ